MIRRDTYGVPHVHADSEYAAAYGLGYAMAEDHASAMGRRYLRARGEAAQVFGAEEQDDDFDMRRLDNIGDARRRVGEVGTGYRTWLDGFASGVNAYVDAHGAEVPEWMPRIDAADLLAYGRSGAVGGALRAPRALLDKYPIDPRSALGGRPSAFGDRVSAFGAPTGDAGSAWGDEPGSNAVAVSGSRTTSGAPLLLGNPHLQWSSLYWEAHVTVPGRFDFYGSTLVGLPVLRAGFNQHLGYVQTNNAPDLLDILAFPIDTQADRLSYRHGTRVLPVSTRRVALDVRRPDGGTDRVIRTFEHSPDGPVVHRTADRLLVARSLSLESWRYHEGFYDLMSTRSLEEFQTALARQLIPTSNFTYADVKGNILYQWNARLPRRRDLSRSYELDEPMDDGEDPWDGLHPLSDLPRVLNPHGGYVQNANNSPWWTSLTDRLRPDRFPAYVERRPLALRPQVALRALEGDALVSPDTLLALKFDTRMLLADRVLPDLIDASMRLAPEDADVQAGVAVLEGWDRRVAAQSAGAVLFKRAWDIYVTSRPAPFAEEWNEEAPVDTPRGLSDPAAAVDALRAAVTDVRAGHGRLDVRWGDVHRFRAGAVDLPADGAPGAYGLYRVMNFVRAPDGRHAAGWIEPGEPLGGSGDGWVLLVHFTNPLEAHSVLAYGQTTRASSPHSRDQLALFAAHRLRKIFFTEAEVERATTSTTRLNVGRR